MVAIITKRNKKYAGIIFSILSILIILYAIKLYPNDHATRALGFFFGCLLAESSSFLTNRIFKLFGLLSFIGIATLMFIWGNYPEIVFAKKEYTEIFFILIDINAFFLINFLINFNSFIRHTLETKLIRSLGQISYTFYLVHAVIGLRISNKIYHSVGSFKEVCLSYVISFFVTFIISSFFFYLTERQYFHNKRLVVSLKNTITDNATTQTSAIVTPLAG